MNTSDLEGAVFVYGGYGKRLAQTQRRAWRVRERAANLAPLSVKVRHKGGKVDVAPQPKKRGGK